MQPKSRWRVSLVEPKGHQPMYWCDTSDETLVFLIAQATNGASPERRLAARFILECLRNRQSRDDILDCVSAIEEEALLDIAADTRDLAAEVGLVA